MLEIQIGNLNIIYNPVTSDKMSVLLKMAIKKRLIEELNKDRFRKCVRKNEEKEGPDIIIEELLKPCEQEFVVKRRKSIRKNIFIKRLIRQATDKGKRNIDLIIFFLHKYTSFNVFLKQNSINDDTLSKVIPYMHHAYYPQGTYIFRAGDFSKRFYGILKGKVSLRYPRRKLGVNYVDENQNLIFKRKIARKSSFISFHNSSKNVLDEGEDEKLQLGEGSCFGEWAIIFNHIRSVSAYTLQNTDLFFLEKEEFDLFLTKPVLKAEMERRGFLQSSIPTFGEIPKFDEAYKRVNSELYGPNKTIYNENSKGQCFYIIFKGLFCLEKNYLLPDSIATKKRMILQISRGTFAGLEVLFSPTHTYAYTLKSSCDENNMLFKIDITKFGSYQKSILEDLKVIYEKEKNILSINQSKMEECTLRTCVSYRNLLSTATNKTKLQLQLEEKVHSAQLLQTPRLGSKNIRKSRNTQFNLNLSDKITMNKSRSMVTVFSKDSGLSSYRRSSRKKLISFEHQISKIKEGIKPFEAVNDVNAKSELYITQNIDRSPSPNRMFHKLFAVNKHRELNKTNYAKLLLSKEIMKCVNQYQPNSQRSAGSESSTSVCMYNSGTWCMPLIGKMKDID